MDTQEIVNASKTKSFKALMVLVVLAVAFIAGRYSRTPETIVETKTEVVTKVVEKQVLTKDKTITEHTISRPDGTVEKIITKNNITTNEKERSNTKSVTESTKETKKNMELPKYSLGAQAIHELKLPVSKPQYAAVVGYRVIGGLWVEGIIGQYAGIGVRWEQ